MNIFYYFFIRKLPARLGLPSLRGMRFIGEEIRQDSMLGLEKWDFLSAYEEVVGVRV